MRPPGCTPYTQHLGPNGQPVLDQITPIQYLGGDSTEPSANTDWQNQVYKTGWIVNNDLLLTAGTEHSSLLLDLNYLDNSSIMRYNPYRRYGGRMNAATSLFNDKLKIGNNLQFFQGTETPVPSDLGGASVLYDSKFVSPLIPVYTTTGSFAGPQGAGFSDRDNPLLTQYLNRWNKNNEYNLFGNLYAELSLFKNLSLRSNFGYAYDNTYDRQILQTYQSGFISRTVNSLNIGQGHELDLTWSNTANYHLVTGKHRLDILGGIEAVNRNYVTQNDYKQGFAVQSNNYFQLSAGTGITSTNGTTTGDRLLSYFGKLNYSWSDRWLASVTLRDDESSRFGANNRYGLFPAGSIGWRINNENFLKDINWLSDLKLRSGYGVTGNQEIGDEASLALYQTNYGTVGQTGSNQNTGAYGNNGTAYDINGAGTGNLPSGYVEVQAANPNLKWESTTEFNEGVDFAFLQHTIFGSFDYFSRKTTNILIQPPYAAIEGEGETQWVNGATKSNKGWELSLGYQNHAGKLSYSVTGNLFSFHDKITYLPSTVVAAYPGNVQKTILGHSAFSEFGYQVQGIYQNQQDIAGHAYQAPNETPGRLMYKDLNGNDTIDALDQTWLGVALPKLNYGLQINLGYGDWSFSLFLQGITGGVETNSNKANTDFLGLNPGVNIGQRALGAWTATNTKSNIPALSLVDNNDEERFSSYYVESSSYMKIRNAQIGYTLPKKAVQSLKAFDGIKVYIMGENLATFYKKHGADAFSDKDPENPGGNFPIPRKITAGINLSF